MFTPSLRNIEYLAENLREDDRIEIEAATGLDALSVLQMSVKDSTVCFVDDPETPAVIFGFCNISDPTGKGVWLLGTDEIEARPLEFCKASKSVIQGFFDNNPRTQFLCNYTHIDNVVHHKWLEWLGAVLGPALPYGPEGALFRPFILKRK